LINIIGYIYKIILTEQLKKYNCRNCNKIFYNVKTRWSHEKICKTKINLLEENNKLKIENEKLKKNNQLAPISSTNNKDNINNQLINIIVNKTKKIEQLKNIIEEKESVESKKEKEVIISSTTSLTLNNIVIISRSEDNYINATQLCQAGGKKFSHWYSLDTTKELINEAASDAGIPA
jgi:hypothetical protein